MDNIRSLNLETLVLKHGNHATPDDGLCVMEAVAYFAGEPHSDVPQCVSPVIRRLLMRWNDRVDDDSRQLLKPLIARVAGTRASTAVERRRVERRRAWLAADWAVRYAAPYAFDATKQPDVAKRLRGLPAVTPATQKAARKVCQEIRAAATAYAYAAAYAATAYAYAAAYAATAYAAAYAATAYAYAAADAAYAAAAAADAADAAAYAATAGGARKKAYSEITPQLVRLVERMVEVK